MEAFILKSYPQMALLLVSLKWSFYSTYSQCNNELNYVQALNYAQNPIIISLFHSPKTFSPAIALYNFAELCALAASLPSSFVSSTEQDPTLPQMSDDP